MFNTREKLIEILRKTRYEYRRYISMKDYEKRMAKTEDEICAVDDSIVGECPFCADHLIANGVTVQEWISVKDRLPEKDVKVLTFGVYGFSVNYRDRFSGKWRGVNGRPQWITHWMPLPEAPKGE